MTNTNGKTVKLSKNTLDLIETYRIGLIEHEDKNTMKCYFQELSYDKLIRLAICEKLVIVRDRS